MRIGGLNRLALRPRRKGSGIGACLVLIALGLSPASGHGAGSDEIQVYTDDINEPGQMGLEVHANFTAGGDFEPAYRGDLPSQHLLRVTPEFSYGLTKTLEAGLYLPLSKDREDKFYLDGVKIRLKWIPELKSEAYFAGLNWELGCVSKRLEEGRWNMELRPILGFRSSTWLISFNPILGWALSGGESSGWPTLEPAIKVEYGIGGGIGIGFEHYADLGRIDHLQPFQEQGHTTYGAIDF
ncbi:MAG: hypothetical protein QHH30_10275, partial [candidate division NC10 bacterium]|nr:hypothetical protein [candidate division NC10 bacterium]